MEIFVYSDESGTFDKVHNEYFVFGGVILLGTEMRDDELRKFLNAEETIRKNGSYGDCSELKACRISNKEKGKLFRSLNHCIRFGVVVRQRSILDRIFGGKKDKQRYLDYAYKIGLRRCFEKLIEEKVIDPNEVTSIKIYADEHTTATNGRYELREGLEQEFKNGTFNGNYDKFFPPVFRNLKEINLQNCNSCKNTLVRAADIVANRIYYEAVSGNLSSIRDKVYLHILP
ncbi:DUF3800 domain-containing protein [Lachnospiraceae bacterium 54-53]